MFKFGIAARLLFFSVVVFVGFALLAGLASWKINDSISAERVGKVRSLTEAAVSKVKSAYDRFKKGELTEEAAKTLIKNELRTIKYSKDGYFFIYDYDGFNVMHGAKPEREGKSFYDAVDPTGKQLVKEQIEHARDGTNIVSFMFPRVGSDVPVPKLSYQIAFDPWRWVIGTGVYVDDIKASFKAVVWPFFSIATAIGSLMAACAYFLSRRITRPLGHLARFT
jgi:methyl-accepting chemotaxis protein